MSNYDYFNTCINPFLIDIVEKDEYSIEDYISIQEKLKTHSQQIEPFLDSLYPESGMRTSLTEMKHRCKRGINATIIDVLNPVLPEIKTFMVGNGGNGKNGFVCCTPVLNDRCTHSQTILQSLEDVGFNGHFLLLNGGFPNPTGIEMKYIGVPYCFKIFMMMEAKKRGFDKVIWIDAACYALNNPKVLFDMLENYDSIFRSFPPNCFAPETCKNICFPKTIDILCNLVDRDVSDDINVNSIVFGLNLASDKMIQFVNEYYKMTELGLPFLSAFPEEIVFTALFNKPEYKYVFNNSQHMRNLYINEHDCSKEHAKQIGIFFSQRKY